MPQSAQVAQLDQVSWVDRLEDLEQAARELQGREASGRMSLQARIDLSARAYGLLFPALGDPAVVIASCRASAGLGQPVLVATELPTQLGSLMELKARCWSEMGRATGPEVGELVAPDDWPDCDDLEPEDAAEPESVLVPEAEPDLEAEPTHEPEVDPEPEPDLDDDEVELPAWAMADPVEPQQQSELPVAELAAWFAKSIPWVYSRIRAGILMEGAHYRRQGRCLMFGKAATFDALEAAGYTVPDAPLSTVEAVKTRPQPPEGWLSVTEVRDRLGLPLKQLRNWSRCGIIPSCSEVLIGKARYYDPDVIAALENLRARHSHP